MKKISFVLLAAFLSFSALGQNRTLTLEESVMQQGRAFRADTMLGFQWIPGTDKYTYFEQLGRKLMTASVSNSTATEVVTLADAGKAMGTELRSFGGMQWKNANTFVIATADGYFEYNTESKKGKKMFEISPVSENHTLDKSMTHVAFTESNNLYYTNSTGQNIAVTLNTDTNIVSGQSIARSEFGIHNGIFWSPDTKLLAFYQKDETDVANYPLLNIMETPGTLENIKYPMIGQKSEKPRVGIYNLATKATVFITPRNAADDYLTNLSWTPDGKFVLIAEVNRGQNDMSLNVYDATTGAFVRTILNEKNSKWVEPEHPAFFPSALSSNFIWISEKDGFNNLYYYSIEGKLIRQLTSNRFVTKDIIGSNKAGTEIFFTATGPNPTNTLVYKTDLKGRQALLTKEDGTYNAAVSEDGRFLFGEYSNHSTPSKSVLIDSKSGKVTTLLTSKNKYDGYTMGTAEIKTIKAADGNTDLYTILIKPSNFDPSKKYPVLVYVYGGPHAQMITNSYLDGASLWMYWMAEQGYLVFTLDNRGSDNRGFAFESVIHGSLGDHEIDDQIKGVEYLKGMPFVDGNRIAVHGWSYGGFMTTSLMLRKPGTFTTGVAGGPVTDWKYYEVMYGERYMDTPVENAKGFEKSSTMNYVKDLQGKLLLIHGTSDDVVVMQHNLALVKKFVDAGKQVDFFPYPMHKHNVGGKDRVHLMQKVLEYVIQNNK